MGESSQLKADKQNQRQHVTKLVRRWKKICTLCGKQKPVPGRAYCKTCAQKTNVYVRQRRRKLQLKGYCYCGRKLKKNDAKYCSFCHKETKRRHEDLRLEVMQQYATNGVMKCVCCGETTFEFLQFDHVHGDGHKPRKEIGGNGGVLYLWLKKHKYPPIVQLMCANCNYAKAHYGCCPHKPGVLFKRPARKRLQKVKDD